MKKITFLVFSIVLSTLLVAAQENSLKITSESSDKKVVMKEKKRVRIKTKEGRKISGRFEIIAKDSIKINKATISLDEIVEIKRNPLLTSILISGILIYAGSLTAGVAVVAGVFAETSAYYLLIPAGGLIYTGLRSPNFYKKYKLNGEWSIEIIEIRE